MCLSLAKFLEVTTVANTHTRTHTHTHTFSLPDVRFHDQGICAETAKKHFISNIAFLSPSMHCHFRKASWNTSKTVSLIAIKVFRNIHGPHGMTPKHHHEVWRGNASTFSESFVLKSPCLHWVKMSLFSASAFFWKCWC